jgi:hypothetical protein
VTTSTPQHGTARHSTAQHSTAHTVADPNQRPILVGTVRVVMADRERQRQREVDIGENVGTDVDVPERTLESSPQDAATDDGMRARIREGAGRVVSGKALVLSLILVVGGMVLVGWQFPMDTIGSLLGIVLAAFLYGVGSEVRHYVELALAGAIAGGGSALLGNLVMSLLGVGIPVVVFWAIVGALAALVGHYFGRDLRDGLTRDL